MNNQDADRADNPPEKWWIPAYGRTIQDFGFFCEREPKFFRDIETIKDLCAQRAKLAKRSDLFICLSLAGAGLMIGGGLHGDQTISVLGFEAPAQILTVQMLGLLVAGIFSKHWQNVISLTILSQIIDKIVSSLVPEEYIEFVTCRFESEMLWTNTLRGRSIGYQSPWLHKLAGLPIPIVGLIGLSIHTGAVVYAEWLSVKLSLASSQFNVFLVCLSVMGLILALLSFFIFLMTFLIPLPFRFPKTAVGPDNKLEQA